MRANRLGSRGGVGAKRPGAAAASGMESDTDSRPPFLSCIGQESEPDTPSRDHEKTASEST